MTLVLQEHFPVLLSQEISLEPSSLHWQAEKDRNCLRNDFITMCEKQFISHSKFTIPDESLL